MKTRKLNLNDLKVESFVTSMESKNSKTVKGGMTSLIWHSILTQSLTLPCGPKFTLAPGC